MKRIISVSVIVTILLVVLWAAAGAALASRGPLVPTDLFYPFQRFAEDTEMRFIQSPTIKARYALTLGERRVGDIKILAGTKQEGQGVAVLGQALDKAILAVADSPAIDRPVLQEAMLRLLQDASSAFSLLKVLPASDPSAFTAFQAKLNILLSLSTNPTLARADVTIVEGHGNLATRTPVISSAPGNEAIPTIASGDQQIVAFQQGSPGAQHDFYPLVGKHALLDCKACHPSGTYTGTPNTCEACHLQKEPANHYPGSCALCHNPSAWTDVHFDHAATSVTDCISCHVHHKPDNHFDGQCSLCHSTSAWKPASFNHQGDAAKDCTSCHTRSKPANHYNGQCSACHSTSAWLPASFDHQVAGATNCISCHAKNEPANHYNGQCSACHSTSGWLPAHFNHQAAGATNCTSCHTKNKPANHFSGQCSACHSTRGWLPASFNHQAAGATNCIACHAKNRPANHFDGQCSMCHSTKSWQGATFNHSFPTSHGGANGVCSKCHPNGTSSWTCYTCHDKGQMETKHAEQGIQNIATRCVACHPNGRSGN